MSLFSREHHSDHNPGIYWTLTKRHFKIFFKNKFMFFFALLVPLITLVIYVIFLRELEVSAINNGIKEVYTEMIGRTPGQGVYDRAYLMADAWMLSGIVAVSCISVSLNTCYIIIEDKEKGVNKDFISSPISRRSVNISYFLFNILATLLITFCVMLITFIYLWGIGGVQISFAHCMLLIPILILSVISASLITCFVASFVAHNAIFNSIVAIASSAAGFLIGAFMPLTMLPPFAQKVTLFFPGTYSAGLFRTYYLTDYYNNFENYLRVEEKLSDAQILAIKDKISGSFSMDIDFFGFKVTPGYMVLIILIFAVFFVILDVLFIDRNFTQSIAGKVKSRKKK